MNKPIVKKGRWKKKVNKKINILIRYDKKKKKDKLYNGARNNIWEKSLQPVTAVNAKVKKSVFHIFFSFFFVKSRFRTIRPFSLTR